MIRANTSESFLGPRLRAGTSHPLVMSLSQSLSGRGDNLPHALDEKTKIQRSCVSKVTQEEGEGEDSVGQPDTVHTAPALTTSWYSHP